jgi:hypothetical protein
MYGGGITPSWIFAHLTVNPTSPLFNAMRTKIQYVTITVAPVTPSTPTTAAAISDQGQVIDSANLIGRFISTGEYHPVTVYHPIEETIMSLTPAQMDVKIANDPTFAVLVHALGKPLGVRADQGNLGRGVV